MNKLLIILIYVFSLMANNVCAQKLYMFIVYQNDTTVGITNKETMQQLADEIDKAVPNLQIINKVFKGAEMSKSKIKSELNTIKVGSNDIIWYYYTGYGENYDTWPQTDQQQVPITWVFDKMKAKKPRLSITMYDCCNYRTTLVPTRPKPTGKSYLKYLLLEYGHIIASSSSPREFSYGGAGLGSIYTNKFYDAIHDNIKWEDVFEKTKYSVQEWARSHEKVQNPMYVGHVYYISKYIPPPPRVRKGDTWESIVAEWNNTPGNKNKITVKQLKSWNKGKKLTPGMRLLIKSN